MSAFWSTPNQRAGQHQQSVEGQNMPSSKFRIKVDYFGLLSKRIGAGEYVDGEALADALQKENSLSFPPTFRDYLCRFMTGEVRRRRGRPKGLNYEEQHCGTAYRNKMEYITKRIQSGDYVGGAELADVLRSEFVGEIPDIVLDYLCQFLTGKVKKPRGRPPMPPTYRRRRDMIIHGFYRRYTEYLIKRQAREDRAAGWTRLPYLPAEMAARLVARNWYHGEASWRSVQTISSNSARFRK